MRCEHCLREIVLVGSRFTHVPRPGLSVGRYVQCRSTLAPAFQRGDPSLTDFMVATPLTKETQRAR